MCFLKAFDKVRDDGLLYRLKLNGINGDLSKVIERFLSDKYQRVVLEKKKPPSRTK